MKPSSFNNGHLSGILFSAHQVFHSLINKITSLYTSLLTRFGLKRAGKISIGRHFVCRFPGNISLGKNVIVGHSNKWITEIPSSTMTIRDFVSIGDGVTIDFSGDIIIEKGAHIAHGVYIITHDHGHNFRNSPIGKKLVIGSNAFIGVKALVLPNVCNIGANSVVGAGSVLTKDVPSKAIVAGNPARIIGYRDDL